MPRAPLSLKAQALALLARREHSRVELRRKLLAHLRKQSAATAGLRAAQADDADIAADADDDATHTASAEVDELLDWLTDQRYLSEARFVESRVHARAASHGKARIQVELARHGVELDPALAQELRNTELDRARDVWRRKFGEVATDATEQARQMRFLASRGFASDVVRRIVSGRALTD